jgi:hypothetical protein
MSDFAPGVARMRAAGYKVEVAPYPDGAQGIRLSLEEVAQKIRDGRLDSDMRGWAGDVLITAGRPRTVKQQAQAILDAFRAETVYVPDPVGAEMIATGSATMCLRPGLCVRARDCDDSVVAVGSALMSIGIPVVVVKQNFGPQHQEHVLVEFQDENGNWIPMDPSTNSPAGFAHEAVEEVRIDPMDVIGSTGTSGAEIVTLGAPPCCGGCASGGTCEAGGACDATANEPSGEAYLGAPPANRVGLTNTRQTRFYQGRWWEWRYGRTYYFEAGTWREYPTGPIHGLAGDCQDMRSLEAMMAQGVRDAQKTQGQTYFGMAGVGVGDSGGVLPSGNWTLVPDMHATAGLRYVLIFGVAAKPAGLPDSLWGKIVRDVLVLSGGIVTSPVQLVVAHWLASNGAASMTSDDIRNGLSTDWLVESVAKASEDPASHATSWVVQAVAKHDQTVGTTKFVTFTALYRQGAPVIGPPQVTPPQTPPSSGNSSGAGIATLAAIGVGAGVAAGVGYALWRRSRRRGRK